MSFLATAASVIGIVGGGMSIYKGLTGDDNSGRQQQANAGADRLADTQAGIAQGTYDRLKEKYYPVEDELIAQRDVRDRTPELQDRFSADLQQQEGGAYQSALRRMSTYGGIDPSSPAAQALASKMALNHGRTSALGLTDIAQSEKNRVEDTGFSRRLAITNLGRGFSNDAAGMLNSAASNKMAVANSYGRAAAADDASAVQGGYALGSGLDRLSRTPYFTQQRQNQQAINTYGSDNVYGGGGTGTVPSSFDPSIDEYADGGEVRRAVNYASGGEIRGPGNGTSDSIPAKVDGGRAINISNGEYIIPADVVKTKGTEFFHKLLEKYHRPVNVGSGRAANGGAVKKIALPRMIEDAILATSHSHALRGA